MKAGELQNILAPFASLANRHALSNIYKTLEISPSTIRGCAPWGILEADCELGNADPFWVDAAHFIGVIKSLSRNDDLTIEIKSNALHWECGAAEGKLALHGQMEIPNADWSILKKKLWSPPKEFAEALQLGALSCGPQSMASAGVYGAAFDFMEGAIAITSSDSVTMALCCFEADDGVKWPIEKLALVPDALAMLVMVLKQKGEKPPKLDFQEKSVTCNSGPFRLLLRPAPLLKHDILKLCNDYAARDVVAKIPGERVKAFIARAAALAESKQHTYVKLQVAEGALKLAFAEGVATSDEYYIVEDLDVPGDLPEIRLDAQRVARVLAHADQVALDHIERGVLVFFGEEPEFSYLICGIKEAEKG